MSRPADGNASPAGAFRVRVQFERKPGVRETRLELFLHTNREVRGVISHRARVVRVRQTFQTLVGRRRRVGGARRPGPGSASASETYVRIARGDVHPSADDFAPPPKARRKPRFNPSAASARAARFLRSAATSLATVGSIFSARAKSSSASSQRPSATLARPRRKSALTFRGSPPGSRSSTRAQYLSHDASSPRLDAASAALRSAAFINNAQSSCAPRHGFGRRPVTPAASADADAARAEGSGRGRRRKRRSGGRRSDGCRAEGRRSDGCRAFGRLIALVDDVGDEGARRERRDERVDARVVRANGGSKSPRAV